MVEEKPSKANEGSGNLHKDVCCTQRDQEVLLPERHVVIDEAEDVVEECLLVHRSVDTHVGRNENCLDKEVTRREKAGPHVAVPRHHSALFIIEEIFVVGARP